VADKLISISKELTDNQKIVLDCLDTARRMDYDNIFIIGVKDGCEWLHHNGYETLEMVGRLEGIKYQIWDNAHIDD
jgi:hypothetical protein